MAADCKSAGVMPTVVQIHPGPHQFCGSSSVGRASAFQAEGRGFESRLPLTTAYIAQAVEHFLGKEEVTSSSLVVGSAEMVGKI